MPSYTNYVNHTASLVTDKTPPFLPEVVDLLASGPAFRPLLHPQPELERLYMAWFGIFQWIGLRDTCRKIL